VIFLALLFANVRGTLLSAKWPPFEMRSPKVAVGRIGGGSAASGRQPKGEITIQREAACGMIGEAGVSRLRFFRSTSTARLARPVSSRNAVRDSFLANHLRQSVKECWQKVRAGQGLSSKTEYQVGVRAFEISPSS
jgi:hypothetical protein